MKKRCVFSKTQIDYKGMRASDVQKWQTAYDTYTETGKIDSLYTQAMQETECYTAYWVRRIPCIQKYADDIQADVIENFYTILLKKDRPQDAAYMFGVIKTGCKFRALHYRKRCAELKTMSSYDQEDGTENDRVDFSSMAIEPQERTPREILIQCVAELYRQGHTDEQIAERTGKTRNAVRRILDELGYEHRDELKIFVAENIETIRDLCKKYYDREQILAIYADFLNTPTKRYRFMVILELYYNVHLDTKFQIMKKLMQYEPHRPDLQSRRAAIQKQIRILNERLAEIDAEIAAKES